MILFIFLFLVATNCLEWFQGPASSMGNEWTQEKSDSWHSSSINIQDLVTPPQPGMTIEYKDSKYECNITVQQLVLTSSGDVIGTAFCPSRERNGQNFTPLIFGNGWLTPIPTKYRFRGPFLVSADGQNAISIYSNNDAVGTPIYVRVRNGSYWTVDTLDYEVHEMIQLPNTSDSTFLTQKNGEKDKILIWVDPLNPLLNWVNGAPGDKNVYPPSRWGADPTGPRVAKVINRAGEHRWLPTLSVWNTKKTGTGINAQVEFNTLWTANFTGEWTTLTDPIYTRDGRLWIVQSDLPNWQALNMYTYSGTTGKQVGPTISIKPQSFLGLSIRSFSLTSDGKYALISTELELFVITPSNNKFRRIQELTEKRWFWYITIDEENSIAYYVNNCQVIGFCLQNPKPHWNVTVCDAPSTITSMVLGKYSKGGKRRLFVGLSEVQNALQVKVIEPPTFRC